MQFSHRWWQGARFSVFLRFELKVEPPLTK
jgi:hypothetical protein